MGIDRTVTFPAAPPTWPVVADALAQSGTTVQMRMIDGELAFPDEVPPDNWRELRVGAAGAMVTVKRLGTGFTLVAWGNADQPQLALYNALTQALTALGGTINPHE